VEHIAAFDKASKRYGDKVVLEDFSFLLPGNGTIVLMGPSGCGKTTLLRLLAGLEQPDSGQVALAQGKRLSMVFQEDRLLEVLTARENILAVLPPESASIADRCLEQCGLTEEANLYPGEMSGGMKRRLAIARAVAFGGDLLLLDEPFKGLDMDTRRRIIAFVFGTPLWEAGSDRPRATLLVTHDAEEALDVARRILVLDGPPLTIRESLEVPQKELSAGERQELKNRLIRHITNSRENI